jgi:hypothetical protein
VSDAGLYAALETDIATKIAGAGGLVTVAKSMSATDVVFRQGIQKPAAGIIHTGTEYLRPARGVNAPQFKALIKFQIAVAAQSLRGRVDARPAVQTILEAIRDALHFKQPSGLPLVIGGTQAPTGLYRCISEVYADQHPESFIVAAANYNIELMLGN